MITRTRFTKKINYKYSASDIFTSQIDIEQLPKYIKFLLKENYNGEINVGEKKFQILNYKKDKT